MASQCTAPDCKRKHKARGYCSMHYNKVWDAANPARRRAIGKTWDDANKERRRANAKAWHAANPDRARAACKAWRAANPEWGKAYREANKERLRTAKYAWYFGNLERERAAARARKAAHPEQKQASKALRRARIANVVATLTPQEWEAILDAAGHACIYCGGQERLSQDHLIPVSKGGPHTADNVAPACLPCNQSKSVKTVMEFLAESPVSNG